jgi:hypothetical protein
MKPLAALSAVVLVVAAGAACSSSAVHGSGTFAGGGHSSASQPSSFSLPTAPGGGATSGGGSASGASAPGGGSASTMPVSTASVRVANLFAPKGAPGPALDIYDVQLNALNGAPATPIISNVAFGTVSTYAHPHLITSVGQKIVEIQALPAGENPDTQSADASSIGGLIDDGSHGQITFVLSADPSGGIGTGPLAGMSTSQRVESGDDGQGGKGPAAPPPAAGSAELLADDSLVPQTGSTAVYLMIDDSCAPPLNGDPSVKGVPFVFAADGVSPKSGFAVFQTTPGTHQISVVSWTSSTPPTCAQLTARQAATSVTVSAGQQTLVFIYGSTLTDLHLALGPVQS